MAGCSGQAGVGRLHHGRLSMAGVTGRLPGSTFSTLSWRALMRRLCRPWVSPCVRPAIIGYGTDAQKAFYLPRILSGEDFWCQGYSEPHAGSDLAALTMSAVADGDDFICNGSKIWTTHAHESNMMFCLVRTDGSGKPQQGITFILIDMTAPGVTVNPIVMTSGEHIQNAVFFDDVRVPGANVIGQVDMGWTVAKYLLEFERGGSSYGPATACPGQKAPVTGK